MLTGASLLHALPAAQLKIANATSVASRHLHLTSGLQQHAAGAKMPTGGIRKPLQQLLLECHKGFGRATVPLMSEGLLL